MFERSAPICASTLYPNFSRYIRSKLRFTKKEAEDRIYRALFDF